MSNFPDKYNLTRQQNLFLAKKKWDENIYCGMRMECRNVTFPQTQTILNGVNVPNVALDDIQAILNMRDAWQYMIKSIDEDLTLEYICKLNEFVSRNESLEWGVLRSGTVGISGTEYIPPVPDYEKVTKELGRLISAAETKTDCAITAFLWGVRQQLFWDGNKRTSLLIANKILVQYGHGILTITENNMEQFNQLLAEYYNTGEMPPLKSFLYEKALTGIEFTSLS